MRRASAAGVRALGLLASVAVAVVLFLPVLWVPFLGDDLEGIVRGSEAGSVPGVGGSAGHWRPVANLAMALNRELGGVDPFGFHVLNVVVHGVVAALVGLAAIAVPRFVDGASGGSARRAADRRERACAAFATGTFLVLPSHTEAVVWIAGRGDPLSAGFGLAALLAWLRASSACADEDDSVGSHVGGGRPTLAAWRPSPACVVNSVVLLVAALAAKEAALAIPLVASVLEGARALVVGSREGRPWTWSCLARPWPLYATAAAWMLLRALAGRPGGADPLEGSLTPLGLLRRTLALVARSLLPAMPVGAWIVVGVSAGVAVVALSVILARRREGGVVAASPSPRGVCVAALAVATFVAALPASPFGVAASTTAGERFTYLPSVFAVLALVTAWSALLRGRTVLAASVAVVVLAASTALLVRSERTWVRAGELADSVISSLGQLPRDRPALLLDLPERFEGVPVMENAAGAALALVHGWTDPTVLRQPLGSTVTGTAPSTRAERDGPDAWVVTPQGPGDRITARYPPDPGDPFVSSVTGDEERARVEVVEVPPGGVWRVERGRLVPVVPPR